MDKMDKKVQEVIERISSTNVAQEVELLGDFISDILFETNKLALYIDKDKDRVYILFPPVNNKAKEQDVILLLVELLTVLEDLKCNRLIYVSNNAIDIKHFYYQSKEYFEKDQRPNIYRIAKNITLSVPPEGEMKLLENGREMMRGMSLDSQIGEPLVKFLTSRVLPTKSLKEYVKRGFLTKEERYTRRNLKYSVISMVIAISIAVISPLLSVFVSNKYGINTIKQQQLDSLLNRAKPVFVITPTNKRNVKSDSTNNNPIISKPERGNK